MKKIFFLLSLGILFTGCLMTRTDVEEVQQKKVMQDQVVNLQKNTADTQARYNDINGELRDLNGKVETVENKLMLSQQALEKSKKENDANIAETNKKVAALQDEVSRLEGQIAALAAAAEAQAKASVEKPAASSGSNYFEQAEDFYSKKEWKKAIFNYQKFREASPKSKKLSEATLKIGISFQELGMKDEARTFLEEVVSKYGSTPAAKVAKSHLKKLK